MNIIEQLKTTRPEVVVKVTWEEDHDYEWDGDGPDPIDDGYYPHIVVVVAYTIRNGEIFEGCDSLGGCYSKDHGVSEPDINGYLDGLVSDAVAKLDKQLAQ